jgi:hypothetical protein
MTPNPALLQSIEKLDYRVTVGDVAAQAGLELNFTQQGLLALASEAGGHLQVAESGDMVFLFPPNFRSILRNKYWKLRFIELLNKIWLVLFYLIRISFGIILGLSILVMVIAIAVIVIAISSQRKDNDSGGGDWGSRSSGGNGGGFSIFPSDFFWFFYPSYGYDSPRNRSDQSSQRRGDRSGKLNFLEAIFSFLFGDGNPNFDLEERRWQQIAAVIQNQGGAIAAPQLLPYLDQSTPLSVEHEDHENFNEDYILPVLSRFNGYPQVSEVGDIIYAFPELQVTAKQRKPQAVAAYLKEKRFLFSEATSGQVLAATGLGGLNLILALVLGSLIRDPSLVAQLGSFIVFVHSIYGLLLGYAIAFLGIPLIRYFVIQSRNRRIEARNSQRQAQAQLLIEADATLQQKIAFARQFADEKVITKADLAYTTEQDMLEQEAERSDKIDEEWRKRLESK